MKIAFNIIYVILFLMIVSCQEQDNARHDDSSGSSLPENPQQPLPENPRQPSLPQTHQGSQISNNPPPPNQSLGARVPAIRMPIVGSRMPVISGAQNSNAKPIENSAVPINIVGLGSLADIAEQIFPKDKVLINSNKPTKTSFAVFTFHSRMDPEDVGIQLKKMNINTPYIVLGMVTGKDCNVDYNLLIKLVEEHTKKKVLKFKPDNAGMQGLFGEFRPEIVQGKITNLLFPQSLSSITDDIKKITSILAPIEAKDLSDEDFVKELKKDPEAIKFLNMDNL